MRVFKHLLDINKIIIAYTAAKFLKNFNRDEIWLISEREKEAEDNGYYLFKYIRENHPEERVYYLIDRSSKGYKRIEKYGNIIEYNSFKHYIYYFLAEKHISAFQFFGVPDWGLIWHLEKKGFFKKKRIFLQHGVINAKIPSLNYEESGYDLLVCSAKKEYEYIKNNYGYPEGNVKYLGLCRQDGLHENIELKKQILLIPTWRSWIGMKNRFQSPEEDYKNFINSEYYKVYTSFLNSEKLWNLLENEKYKLLFYLHPEAQRFKKYFTADNSRIKIVERESVVLQDLLKESEILITDYSSVAFEFAYMRKKLIYYQFDQKEYYKNHFERGYLDYEKEGFGKVVKDEGSLIETLIQLIGEKNTPEIYRKRSEDFFPLYDNKNCQRNYEAIKKI